MGEAVPSNTTRSSSTNGSSDSTAGQGEPPAASEPQPPDIRVAGDLSQEKPICPHSLSAQAVAEHLGSHVDHGLSPEEAAARLDRDGPNSIEAGHGVSLWQIFLAQVANALTVILIAVMAISFAIQDYIEGGVVAAVIALNIIVGLVQDYRAEQTIQSLYALSSPRCNVIRNSQHDTIKAEALVKGDIVTFTVGDIIPADLRLIFSANLSTDESMLTGESVAISKNPDALFTDPDTALGDRINLVYSGCSVTRGRASGIVVATGMETEVGQIAKLLRNSKDSDNKTGLTKVMSKSWKAMRALLGLEGTPLQVTLSKFALLLFALAIILAIVVFSVSLWEIDEEVLLYGICVGVAVIPESLLAVLTITMAVATKSMVKGHVIVRHLPSLEAVGGVTDICSDKTGTLTQGRMVTRKVWLRDDMEAKVEATSDPYDPGSGSVTWTSSLTANYLEPFLKALSLCNNATVHNPKKLSGVETDSSSVTTTQTDAESSQWEAIGEPTEVALKVFAMRFGRALSDSERITEHAFDSTVKCMSTVYGSPVEKTKHVYSKGAVEFMLPKLGEPEQLKKDILAKADELAAEGLRVLCVADKVIEDGTEDPNNRDQVEKNLHFLGLAALYDPPRPETAGSVRDCKGAGVVVHMVTGDHVKTATAIAYEVGILDRDACLLKGAVMEASEFSALTDEQIDQMELPIVLARCSPVVKVRMIEALHRRKAFCIMTGDGVNDSPALKRADIGIAMGLRGSDVAKEAADMVLTDDNFASIVTGIKEGRRLTDNIQKFLLHLLTTNLAQVILLLIGLAFKDVHGAAVFTLSPLEILWANLVSSSPLALGLGLEEASPDVLRRPPRSMKSNVFTADLVRDQFVYGILKGVLSLGTFMIVAFGGKGFHELAAGCNEGAGEGCELVFRARATTFATLTFLLLVTGWEVKHFHKSLFAMEEESNGPFCVFKTIYYNRFLFWSVIVGFVVTFPVVHIPYLNEQVFKHYGITWEWGVVFGGLVIYVALVELWKAAKRRYGWGIEKYDHGHDNSAP